MQTSNQVNPTVVFVTKQISYTVSSLAMICATIILALNHFIQDGEIVTLLVAAVGSHVLASVNGGLAPTTSTDNSVNNPAPVVAPPNSTVVIPSVTAPAEPTSSYVGTATGGN